MYSLNWLTRERLAKDLGMSFVGIANLARVADTLYRPVSIIDRGGKPRELSVPNRPLKLCQTRIYRRILRRIDYHPATFCVRGRGVVAAAERHQRRRCILNLDVSDFFPSVNTDHVRDALRRRHVPENVIPTLARLVTHRNMLPQGAPTSVALGDLVLEPLDKSLTGMCQQTGAGFTYTRYVDDIIISGGERLARFENTVRRIVAEHGWRLNTKGGVFGRHEQHKVLGLVVNSSPNVDRVFYGDVRFLLTALTRDPDLLTAEQKKSLEGKINWIEHVNPTRGARLRNLQQPLGDLDPAPAHTAAANHAGRAGDRESLDDCGPGA